MIEISCHGGSAVKASIVNAAIEGGARIANPGEFSLRSFLNGKMDLVQAEAVAALISSRSRLSSEISLEHLSGKASRTLKSLKLRVLDLLSLVENELNFSEDEIILTKKTKILLEIKTIKTKIFDLLRSSVIGKNIFDGIRVVICGRPNSGKSTLFNAILGHNRTITASTPGTTRESVEAWFELGGVPVCLVDTAGVWATENELDRLGVEKTFFEIDRADICLIIDENNPNKFFKDIFRRTYQHHNIFIRSKSDLVSSLTASGDYLLISSIKNTGIDSLLTLLSTRVVNSCSYDAGVGVLITERQRSLLEQSSAHLGAAIEQLESDVSMDIVASTLRGFVLSIKEIVGEFQNKEIIENIFNNFCVGK
jgi:tRNA modification GTPase